MDSSGFIAVDGSCGEGGGQIVRTAVALSAILGKPIEVRNIRAKRDNPGLRPQHVAAIRAVASICDAVLEGLQVGTKTIYFTPGRAHGTHLKIDIGSAGSITLLLQALIPVASMGGAGVNLEILGGTDVRWSPTLDYFRYVVLPAYRLIGIEGEIQVIRRGYYPKGGGVVGLSVKPAKELRTLNVVSSSNKLPSIFSVCSKLPISVAKRQLDAAKDYIESRGIAPQYVDFTIEDAISPGSSILVSSVGQKDSFIGGDAIGERGKPAELVGVEAAEKYVKNYWSGAPIDVHLGDMLITPLALVHGESKFKVSCMSPHITTNLHVAKQLTACDIRVDELVDRTAIITITNR